MYWTKMCHNKRPQNANVVKTSEEEEETDNE